MVETLKTVSLYEALKTVDSEFCPDIDRLHDLLMEPFNMPFLTLRQKRIPSISMDSAQTGIIGVSRSPATTASLTGLRLEYSASIPWNTDTLVMLSATPLRTLPGRFTFTE